MGIAIGAGLALGREGPSVQIGATLAHWCGKLFRCNWRDCRVLMAAGAGLYIFGTTMARQLSATLASGLSLTREQAFDMDVLGHRMLADVVQVLAAVRLPGAIPTYWADAR